MTDSTHYFPVTEPSLITNQEDNHIPSGFKPAVAVVIILGISMIALLIHHAKELGLME
jgi:hypothetical protein